MAKKRIITGKRLKLVEEIVQKHNDLAEVNTQLKEYRTKVNHLRTQRRQIQAERNELIRTAINRHNVPPIRIGERLGFSKSSIHLIHHEKK